MIIIGSWLLVTNKFAQLQSQSTQQPINLKQKIFTLAENSNLFFYTSQIMISSPHDETTYCIFPYRYKQQQRSIINMVNFKLTPFESIESVANRVVNNIDIKKWGFLTTHEKLLEKVP